MRLPPISVEPGPWDVSGLPMPYLSDVELPILIELVASVKARTMIEFGCQAGQTAAAILRNVPSLVEYVGVDVPADHRPTLATQRSEVPMNPGQHALADSRFRLIVRPRGTFDLAWDDLPMADIVFIDGDHSRAGVWNDYALARAAVRSGGLIIFHDDNGRPEVQVTETLDEIGAPVAKINGTWFAVERVG